MRDNFEKKVQEKLDELKLTPSAPVWDKVASQIKPEKKRRPGFFWVPFLIVLMGGLGWWLMESQQKQQGDRTIQTNIQISTEKAATPVATTNDKKSETVSGKNNKEKAPVSSPYDDIAKSLNLTNKYKTEIAAVQRKGNRATARTTVFDNLASRKTASKEIRNRETGTVLQTHKAGRNLSQAAEENVPDAAIKKSVTDSEVETAAVSKAETPVDSTTPTAVAAEKLPIATKADSVAEKRKVAAATRTWKFSATLQAGLSSPFNGWSTIANADVPPAQNTGGGGSLYNNAPYPNAVSRGAAYAIGGSIARAVSSRLQVSVGLHYALWQTHTKVGSYKPLDTALNFQSRTVAVGGYYLSGSQQDYTTRFHLLEVPLSADFQLLPTVPLFISAGGIYGRLLQSNALSYDRASMVYYENKESLSYNQFSVFSSLQYSIINKKNFRFNVGPVAQWQLTSLQQNAGTARPRLFVAGLKTAFQF